MSVLIKRVAMAATLSLVSGLVMSAPAAAQDVSPTILIETGPNENPQYRRVIFVKYLSGNRVSANYRADNRTEFRRVGTDTPQEIIDSCVNGAATSLRDIRNFARQEQRRARNGQAPETRSFCIKNVRDWERGNKSTYLDPIFESLPYSIQGF
jgi:hypothetical protein